VLTAGIVRDKQTKR